MAVRSTGPHDQRRFAQNRRFGSIIRMKTSLSTQKKELKNTPCGKNFKATMIYNIGNSGGKTSRGSCTRKHWTAQHLCLQILVKHLSHACPCLVPRRCDLPCVTHLLIHLSWYFVFPNTFKLLFPDTSNRLRRSPELCGDFRNWYDTNERLFSRHSTCDSG